MAISLNEGSYGLLMDPLNGVADIETRTLRLVSNYGFIEDPSLLIRATRFKVRLGWELDPRSQQRYENAKSEGAIEYLTKFALSRELEQIGHEDDGLKVLEAFEAEGWMKALFPQWTHAKADVARLHALHDLRVELLMQGVHADMSAGQMQLLTAKLQPKDLSALKKALLRPGFVEEWNGLDAAAAAYAKVLLAKENKVPSANYKLFTSYDPEAVLWLGFTSKDSAVKERYNQFLKVWPETRKQIPYALMQEMRIKPELPGYNDLVQAIFLELIDGRLSTPEEMKAYLEPHSPPPPPPPQPVTIKRPRGRRAAESRVKDFDEDEEMEHAHSDEDLDDMGGEDEVGLGLPRGGDTGDSRDDEAHEDLEEHEEIESDEEEEHRPTPARRGKAAAPAAAKLEKPETAHKLALKPAQKPAQKPVQHESAPEDKPAPVAAKAAAPAKAAPAPAKAASALKPAPVLKKEAAPAKAVQSVPAKAPAKAASKPAPASAAKKAPAKTAAKPAVKKPAAKPTPRPVPIAPAKKAPRKARDEQGKEDSSTGQTEAEAAEERQTDKKASRQEALKLAPAFHRPRHCYLVGVFDVAACRHAGGNPGNADLGRLER